MLHKNFLLFLVLSFTSTIVSAQWFYDDGGTVNSGVAPNPWVNSSASSPGVTNNGVTLTGPGGTGYANWNGGWDGVSTGTTANGASLTWQTNVGSSTTTSVSFSYSLSVTGAATISSLSFGMRRNSSGHTNLAVTINGVPYTPSTSTMSNTSWTPVTVNVSPVLSFTAGDNISIVLTFSGGTGAGGVVQRVDELKIFGSAVLPVEMTKFSAKPASEGFELNWSTATESNNHYFVVERSQDGKSYLEIARINGAGNSIYEQSYQYNDRTPLKGKNYYRLKQIDFDGSFEYSKIIVINKETRSVLSVYPNPSSDIFTINGLENLENEHFTILNSIGQSVSLTIQSNGQLDLSDFPSGLYYLRAFNSDNVIKLIKD